MPLKPATFFTLSGWRWSLTFGSSCQAHNREPIVPRKRRLNVILWKVSSTVLRHSPTAAAKSKLRHTTSSSTTSVAVFRRLPGQLPRQKLPKTAHTVGGEGAARSLSFFSNTRQPADPTSTGEKRHWLGQI